MEQEILSWLETTYERGQETDFVCKETLWNELVNVGRVDSKCREAFFACLGRCISQSSLKGITVTRSKGKKMVIGACERNRDRAVYSWSLSVNGYHVPFVKKSKRNKQRGIALTLIF